MNAYEYIEAYDLVNQIRSEMLRRFATTLSEKINSLTFNDGGPRDASKGVVYECEDRGYDRAKEQVLALIVAELGSK